LFGYRVTFIPIFGCTISTTLALLTSLSVTLSVQRCVLRDWRDAKHLGQLGLVSNWRNDASEYQEPKTVNVIMRNIGCFCLWDRSLWYQTSAISWRSTTTDFSTECAVTCSLPVQPTAATLPLPPRTVIYDPAAMIDSYLDMLVILWSVTLLRVSCTKSLLIRL